MKITKIDAEMIMQWILSILTGGMVTSIACAIAVGIARFSNITTLSTTEVVICSVFAAIIAQFFMQLLETEDGNLSKLTGTWKLYAPIPVAIGGTAMMPVLIQYLVSQNTLDIILGTLFFLCVFLLLTIPWRNKEKTKKPENQ